MKVTLLNYTPDAVELLLFSKNTRLNMSPAAMDEIKSWPMEKKLQELEYMRHTIQSSWEMIDYVFIIEGVSRAFTHQLVRHRHASYAQQAQRVVDLSEFEYITGPSIKPGTMGEAAYDLTMRNIAASYQTLIDQGVKPQDARGVIPTNVSTNIMMKANLRTLHDMALKRLCVKAQGEAQDVFRAMVDAVVAVHPWAADFLRVFCATYGTCQFHTFPVSDCPTKALVYNPDTGEAYGGGCAGSPDAIQERWKLNRAEAQPIIIK